MPQRQVWRLLLAIWRDPRLCLGYLNKNQLQPNGGMGAANQAELFKS
jgi:hypothetical protein